MSGKAELRYYIGETLAKSETWRTIVIYDADGAFKVAVDGTKLDNSYMTISADNGNIYLAQTVNMVPKVACKIRLNFLVSGNVTWANVSV